MKIYIPKNLIRKISILVLFLSSTLASYSQNNQCEVQLTVKNDIVNKKANLIGTSYKLSLLSLEPGTTTYRISINNVDNSRSSSQSNAAFKGEVFPINKRESLSNNHNKKTDSNYLITLNKGERFDFIVELLAPKGVKIGSKNISEVKVTSERCSDFSVRTLLQTEIINSVIKNF